MVSVPDSSSVQVTLLPSPSAPQVPLAASAAKAAGTSASIRLSTSRMLRSFFFMSFLLCSKKLVDPVYRKACPRRKGLFRFFAEKRQKQASRMIRDAR